MAEFKDTPSGGMEVMQNGIWTTVPLEAVAEIRRLREENDFLWGLVTQYADDLSAASS
jgi:hypothetical protein